MSGSTREAFLYSPTNLIYIRLAGGPPIPTPRGRFCWIDSNDQLGDIAIVGAVCVSEIQFGERLGSMLFLEDVVFRLCSAMD